MRCICKVNALQREIVEIMKSVKELCDENNIDYFIIGRTALGAKKYKRFIPCDYDVDIGMTRDNYDKFINLAKDNLCNEFLLQTYETEKDTPFYHARIRKDCTKFIEYHLRHLRINHGIFIEVFPFDNISNNKFLRKKQYISTRLWSWLFIIKSINGLSYPHKSLLDIIKVIIKTLIHMVLKVVPKKFIFKRMDKTIKKYNKVNCSQMADVSRLKPGVNYKDIQNFKFVEFEGIKLKCMNNIEKYISNEFENKTTMPKAKRNSGHVPYISQL